MAKEKNGPSPEKQARPVNRSQAKTHITVYANNAQVQHSPWDFAMKLGQVQRADEKQMDVEDVVTVYMSPAHMKAFAEAMSKNVARYESSYGKIPDPLEQAVAIGKKSKAE